MNVGFEYTSAGAAEKIVFEKVVAEVPGGILVPNPSGSDLKPGTPIYKDSDGDVTATAPSSGAVPYGVLGDYVYAGKGDQLVKCVLAGVIRKAGVTSAQATAIALNAAFHLV